MGRSGAGVFSASVTLAFEQSNWRKREGITGPSYPSGTLALLPILMPASYPSERRSFRCPQRGTAWGEV